ncbi:hypothetical protein MAPG_01873 [Magnaporthiopsis poae ATCC 64411]|uniref:Uncharacterized protein n=1 Tax=Magnaporthiopsis poae (strain ATCC 64411 / 73-15) TaxID=644358 RepID=A0A0C4DPU5_MAGP6|nr:hypothetical protein MAPG_01873 [Magnaporthiopsis poae ATCC 64411]
MGGLITCLQQPYKPLARYRADLDRWDNDTRWDLRPYMTDDNPSAAALFFGGTLLRIKTQGSLTITEEEAGYTRADEFFVETIDGPTGRWLGFEWTDNPRTWVGKYEGYPGQAPRLMAKSWTTNRVKHKDAIAEARRELREHEAALEEKNAMWTARWAQQAAEGRADVDGEGDAARTDADKRMDELVGWIEAAKNLDKVLGQRNPPIDTSFNEAARRRYRKMPSQITADDLYDFVGAAGLEDELVKPLIQVLEGVRF